MNECIVYRRVRRLPVARREIERIMRSVMSGLKKPGSASVHCIGDTAMARLNKLHRGKQGTTDVLSFAVAEGGWPLKKERDWGDIFVCIPQIRRQAAKWGVPAKEEFTRMLVHGLLHLLGYDHQKKRDAKKMFALQEKYLRQI